MSKIYGVGCHELDTDGNGIVEFNGSKFKVPYLLDNEKAKIELVFTKSKAENGRGNRQKSGKAGKNAAVKNTAVKNTAAKNAGENVLRAGGAKLIELTKKSEDRVEPGCAVYGRCGGCTLLHASYEKQLSIKQNACEKILGEYGQVSEIIGADEPYGYRHKVHVTFDQKDGRLVSGIYEESSHRVVPVKKCKIIDEDANRIINSITKLLSDFKIKAYNEDTDTGLVRHLLIRKGYETREIMVVIVIARSVFPGKNNFIKELMKIEPDITTVVFNVNNLATSMVLGPKFENGYGKGYITDTCMGVSFRISPDSFFQVNPPQMKKLYAKALELAEIKEKDSVLDAYCGTGTITLLAAEKAGKVTGVELNPDAVADAKENLNYNLKNTDVIKARVEFIADDAGEYLVETAQDKKSAVDVVIMDPPRSGASEEFLESVLEVAPERVVYVSCNPYTLADNLKVLTKGYTVKEIRPVDMFPCTSKVEVVCMLVKGASKQGVAGKDVVRKDVVKKDVVRKDVARKDVARKDVARKDSTRKTPPRKWKSLKRAGSSKPSGSES